MSLEDAIKELKDQIAEKEKEESVVVEEKPEAEEKQEEKAEAAKEEEKPEEKAEETKEKEQEEQKKEEEEENPDDSAYARLRHKAAANKRKADQQAEELASLRAELAELKKGGTKEEAKEETQSEIVPELEEIVMSHRKTRAEREFQTMEEEFKSSNPEYTDVASEYARALAQSIKIQNPRISNADLLEKTKETILLKAAHFMQKGYNPVEELYLEAKDLGFTGKSMKQEEKLEAKEEEVRPDMKKVASNRSRSAGMTASPGKSEGMMTKQAAAELTNAEWMKLPASEKRRLLAS